jgi:hypothetical protein
MQQDCAMADTHTEVSETVNAGPDVLYDVVSDLPSMGRLSPENTGGKWLGGANGPAVGARFRGNNKAGWRRWSTSATVTQADRGKRFAFRVTSGPVKVADWSFDFDCKDGSTTTITESWDDLRPAWMKALSGPVMGVSDRARHNEANMKKTLQALKKQTESATT